MATGAECSFGYVLAVQRIEVYPGQHWTAENGRRSLIGSIHHIGFIFQISGRQQSYRIRTLLVTGHTRHTVERHWFEQHIGNGVMWLAVVHRIVMSLGSMTGRALGLQFHLMI